MVAGSEEPLVTLTTGETVECGESGWFVYLKGDTAKLNFTSPGSFVMASVADYPKLGFSFVTTPGDPTPAIGVWRPRTLWSGWGDALRTPGTPIKIWSQHGASKGIAHPTAAPIYTYACGRSPLAMMPLMSLLRWDVPKNHAVPRVFWCIHAPEEIEGFDSLLKALPARKIHRPVELTVVRCGSIAHKETTEELGRLQGALPGMKVVEAQDGLSSLPELLLPEVLALEKGTPWVETFGCLEFNRDLRAALLRLAGPRERKAIEFGSQTSFGYHPGNEPSGVDSEPWPVKATIAPFALFPWRSKDRPLPLHDWLFLGCDPLPLAVFRFAFGFLCCYYAVKAINNGRVYRDHVWSDMRFKYDHLEVLGTDIPEEYVFYWYYLMAAAGAGMAIGWPYRLSCILFTITFAWHFFAEATHFNNHYYLMVLLGIHFTLVDANKCLVLRPSMVWNGVKSLLTRKVHAKKDDDAPAKERGAPQGPPLPPLPPMIPYLHLMMHRGLVLFVFFYGAVAKCNNDWISGHVMRAGVEGNPPWLLAELCVFFLAWGGLVFDYIGPIFLSSMPCRPPALFVYTFFNVSNMVLWNIGVFPWMMLGAIPLLCENHTTRVVLRNMLGWAASLPEQCSWKRLQWVERSGRQSLRWLGRRMLPVFPPFKDAVYQLYRHTSYISQPNGTIRPSLPRPLLSYSLKKRVMLTLLVALYSVAHLTFPFRHWVYHAGSDQQVAWTEHGRKFSWHMMSRHKDCSGWARVVHDEMQIDHNITVSDKHYDGPLALNPHQLKKLPTLATYVRQFTWQLRRHYEHWLAEHSPESLETTDNETEIVNPKKVVRVFASISCSCNGSPRQLFVSPDFDLSRQHPPSKPWVREPWIVPQEVFGMRHAGYPDLFPYRLL